MKVRSALLLAGSLLFLFVPSVLAQGPSYVPPTAMPTPKFVSTPQATGQGKLRACQVREGAIKTRMSHLVQLAATMESKFDSIAGRVEAFYASKVVPSGKTLPNYNALVADIGTKKNAVTDSLNKTQTDLSSFSCQADNPKTLFNQFRLDMQTVKKALKDYRTSVRNLIVAVHSVSPSPSPKPTATP